MRRPNVSCRKRKGSPGRRLAGSKLAGWEKAEVRTVEVP